MLKHNFWPQYDMLNYVLHVKTSQYRLSHDMEVLICSRQINWDLNGQYDHIVIAKVLTTCQCFNLKVIAKSLTQSTSFCFKPKFM